MDINSLKELRSRGIYLFPGVGQVLLQCATFRTPSRSHQRHKEIPPILERSFSFERNLQSWTKCGAVLLTRCICSIGPSVKKEERGDDG